jgi:multiple sugar transport system permease protein
MKRQGPLARLVIYVLLIAGSCLFLVPLVWMISTALKPIDQTMSMPPTWIPYGYYVPIDGVETAVIRRERIDYPAVVVRVEGAGEETLVRREEVQEGRIRTTDDFGAERTTAVEIVSDIPASPSQPWVQVVPADSAAEAAPRYVPEKDIVKRVRPLWGNFAKAVHAMRYFPLYLRNTLILCLLTVTGTVISSSLAAYGFARIPWRGRNKVFMIALATMMVPFPVVMVPVFSLFRWLGWIGTLKPLWVHTFCAAAFNVFLLRQFFMTIPKELSEAARIDGCSELRIFLQIILPLSRPALMVVGLFQFMFTWNDFLGPLIFLTNQKDFTLALGLQFFQSQHGGTEWHYLMAASTLIVLPIIVLFFFTQRTFIEGISMTGIKG